MVKSGFSSFLETRWVMLIVLLVFVCFKIPHLFYPFYCDESWVYVRAVKTMVENGPSLLPGCIPDNCARGHPLLFHFLCSLWIKCFGSSNVAVHSFALLTSVLLLISIYEGCRQLFGSRVGVLALLMVATNVLFFVQSAFILPEVMVALFTFLSLYYYVTDRLLLTSAMLLLLFFTKESGLVFGAVIGVDALVCLFKNKESIKRRASRLVAIIIPTLLICVFFLVQKARLGWYLSPEHTSLIHTDWDSFYHLFRDGLYWTFRGDKGHYLLVVFFILLSIVPAVIRKDMRFLFLCLPAIIVYEITNKAIAYNYRDVMMLVLLILFFAVAVYCLLRLNKYTGMPASKFVVLAVIFIVAYMCYLSLSLVEYRYLLVNIVFVFVLLAVCANTYITASTNALFYAAMSGIIIIGTYGFYTDEGNTDADLESFHAMRVQQNEVEFLEKENAYDQEIIIGCYWAIWHFTDTKEGFLGTKRTFTQIKHTVIGPDTRYAIFDSMCDTTGYQHTASDPGFQLAYKTQDSHSWAEIYKRK